MQSPNWAIDMHVLPEASLYCMSANSKGSGETALMHNLARAFVGCLCDKYLLSCAGSFFVLQRVELINELRGLRQELKEEKERRENALEEAMTVFNFVTLFICILYGGEIGVKFVQ